MLETKEWGPKLFDTTSKAGKHTQKLTVWKRSSLFDVPRFRYFCLGLGNERHSWMHIVTSSRCEGVHDGPLSSNTHTHTCTQRAPPWSLTGGRFCFPKGGKRF